MARWGFGARYCSFEVAESAIRQTGALCRKHYSSWAELSAGYALGRVIRFDDEGFGEWYETVLEPHRLLMSDPNSPWRTIAWEQ
ncbi:hypothetical protein GCM10009753_20040 [Streptantibioticus ferralitis]